MMNEKQVTAMWVSTILLRYAAENKIRNDRFPTFIEQYGLVAFLIENYELFHLYPDDAVLDEIDKEIARQTSGYSKPRKLRFSSNSSEPKTMNNENPALVELLIAKIIGFLAAEYSDKNELSLAYSLQYVIDSELCQKLLDPGTALYCESIPLLFEQVA
jgi:hypothetical protein